MEAKKKVKVTPLFVTELVRAHEDRKQIPAEKLKELKTLACGEEGWDC